MRLCVLLLLLPQACIAALTAAGAAAISAGVGCPRSLRVHFARLTAPGRTPRPVAFAIGAAAAAGAAVGAAAAAAAAAGGDIGGGGEGGRVYKAAAAAAAAGEGGSGFPSAGIADGDTIAADNMRCCCRVLHGNDNSSSMAWVKMTATAAAGADAITAAAAAAAAVIAGQYRLHTLGNGTDFGRKLQVLQAEG